MLNSKLDGYYRLLDSSKGTPEKIRRSIQNLESEYLNFKEKYQSLNVFENLIKNIKVFNGLPALLQSNSFTM